MTVLPPLLATHANPKPKAIANGWGPTLICRPPDRAVSTTDRISCLRLLRRGVQGDLFSSMPEGVIDKLPEDKVRDLFRYLQSSGPPPK